jgi:hypothetical protein
LCWVQWLAPPRGGVSGSPFLKGLTGTFDLGFAAPRRFLLRITSEAARKVGDTGVSKVTAP